MGRTRNQGRFDREDPQAVLFLPVRCCGKRGAKIQQGRSVRERHHLVPGSRRANNELPGACPVTGVKGKRLLRGKRPVLTEAAFKVGSGKRPERLLQETLASRQAIVYLPLGTHYMLGISLEGHPRRIAKRHEPVSV